MCLFVTDSFQWMYDASSVQDYLAVIGTMYLIKKSLGIILLLIKGISTHWVSRLGPINLHECGSWAVVTGPTEGIGKAYAMELAERGLNIFLLGRNARKLQRISDHIEDRFGVDTKIYIIDFNESAESYKGIKELLEGLEVSIFVNNAGAINKCPSYIYELTDDDIETMVNVNVKSLTIMTKLAVAYFRKKNEDFKGIIVNVSSIASLGPAPLWTVYAATKAYVTSFSRAVGEEVHRQGITVQTLIPSYVKTRMVDYSPHLNESWFVPSAETYARNAVYTLGYSTYTTGFWIHGLQEFLASLCPDCVWMFLIHYANVNFRREYYSRHED